MRGKQALLCTLSSQDLLVTPLGIFEFEKAAVSREGLHCGNTTSLSISLKTPFHPVRAARHTDRAWHCAAVRWVLLHASQK